MKRVLTILMLLCCLMSPALAEGAHFSGERNNGCRPALAVVNGQVYGLSGRDSAFSVFTPAVERWSPAGKRTRVGQNAFLNSEIGYISGAGDALLIVREERSWLTLLDPTAPFTPRAELWYPATGRRVRVADGAFAMQGQLYVARDGQVQQLSADGRKVLAAWPGTLTGRWDTFLMLQDGQRRMVLEAATGTCTDVTGLDIPMKRYGTQAVLEGGVLYLLADTKLLAIDLADGTRRALLTFPADTYNAFVLDETRIILIGQSYMGDPIRSAVYDRATLQRTLTFTHRTNPTDVLLAGDVLYLRSPYSGAYLGQEGSWRRNSSASIIDLTTGGEVWWELDQ